MSAVPSHTTPASIVHHVDALQPGTRLGEFEVLALLGVGGFGMVYQAFDHSLLRFVAIKEYMPAALAGRAQGQSLWVRSSTDTQSFKTGLTSFVDEARLLAQFDHPSLVKVFRFWEANHTAYMVMPLYSGMTLKQARAHMRTPPPEAWLRKVLWSVTSALRVLHEGGALHRDISPDNIFLQDQGPPVLLDLGAARRAITGAAQQYTAVLKVNYAPIEQYADAAVHLRQGPWSDLYSLGAVVHGCLCNDTPLPSTLRSIRDRMVSFSRVARTVRKQFGVEYSRPFVDAVSQCLALQPEGRPQSIDAFLQAMEMTTAPAGWESFDFRAELGDIWVEPSSKDDQGVATAVIDITALSQPQEPPAPTGPAVEPADADAQPPAFEETVVQEPEAQAFADTRAVAEPRHDHARRKSQQRRARGADSLGSAAGPSATAAAASAPRARRFGRRRAAPLIAGVLAAAAVSVLAASWWWSQPPRPRYTPDSEIITELAQEAPALPAPQVSADSELPALEAPPPAAVEPAAVAAVPTVPAAAPVAAPKARPARRAEPAPAPPVADSRPAAPPESAPAPAPRPAPAARAPGPDEACASASFFARSMCIHQECQKPGAASHPVCVDNRRRREAEERQRQMYPQ